MYLSNSLTVMRYVKHCSDFMIDEAFKKYHLLTFNKIVTINSKAEIERARKELAIKYDSLKKNIKYYGILITDVKLFPKEGGYLKPVR